ncbi:MAG: matrixin family metalloprotease [bacterium]|nr:matrixin family metalloprotease [bacterium]
MGSQPIRANTRRLARVWLCLLGASLPASSLVSQEKPFPVLQEELSTIWEVEGGDPYCSFTPPEPPENAFFFNDFSRWSNTASDPSGLVHGDPGTLTWGFVADGTAIGNGGCGLAGETGASDLIAFLDAIRDPASTGGTDLTQRLWFPVFEQIFTDWGLLNGVNYVYEPNDDGTTLVTGGAGVLGTRADLRIGGHFVDGQSGSNVLACNYFPNNGDMIIDTSNTSFYSSTSNNSRGTRNVLAHEHGHGMGFNHVCPTNQTKLMEPFISTAFDGPQVDDINAANRGYGDRDEFPGQNDASGTATSLGSVPQTGVPVTRTTLSVDSTTDTDFYSFQVAGGSQVTVTLNPTGSTYLNGPQNPNGSCTAGTNFNSLIQSDLALEVRGKSGANVLGSADANGAGLAETISNLALTEGAGTYFVRTFGLNDFNQMYDLSVSTTGAPCTADAFEPDDGSAQANAITSGVPKSHGICPAGDDDWSTFTLAAESQVSLETSGASADTRMWLRDAAASQIEFDDDDGSGQFSLIDRTCGVDALSAGTYFVEVDEFGDDSEIESYALSLTTTPCSSCPPGVILANQTLTGTQAHLATGAATLGPSLIVSGVSISIEAPTVTFLGDIEIGGTFSAGNSPACL